MRYLFNIENYSLDEVCYIYERPEGLKYYLQMNYEHHIPVLLKETIALLEPRDGEVYLDCTFGAGGHTRAILESANCKVISLDRDVNVKVFAQELKKEFGDRFIFENARFADLDKVLESHGIGKVDGILMDLGFSSMQVDTPRRGFSFQADGPLDMRMDNEGLTAEEFVNEFSEEEIANIIFKFGDERKSRAIARAICTAREKEKITTTLKLAEIIKDATGHYHDNINPATRTFQAIRIFINNEFEELKSGLQKAKDKLKENGRVVVITFHSGEDVIVKDFFRTYTGGANLGFSRYSPASLLTPTYVLDEMELLTHKPIVASDEEIEMNFRARSAKIRAAKKLSSGS